MQKRRAPVHDEQGAMAIEFLLVIGMLIVVFLLMLQYAVKAHAQRVAAAAAEEGLAAAASYDGTAQEGERTAKDYLTHLGPGLAHSSVAATRNPTTASVSITGDVDQLIPFLDITVHVHVQGPVEHFVADPKSTSGWAGP
jgi:Flp pilus assembly protein TadG